MVAPGMMPDGPYHCTGATFDTRSPFMKLINGGVGPGRKLTVKLFDLILSSVLHVGFITVVTTVTTSPDCRLVALNVVPVSTSCPFTVQLMVLPVGRFVGVARNVINES